MHIQGRSSPVISHVALKQKGTSSVVEQSFAMQRICIYPVVFKFCVREQKKKERRRMTKLKYSCSIFSTIEKHQQNSGNSFCQRFASLYCGYLGDAPIPYVYAGSHFEHDHTSYIPYYLIVCIIPNIMFGCFACIPGKSDRLIQLLLLSVYFVLTKVMTR